MNRHMYNSILFYDSVGKKKQNKGLTFVPDRKHCFGDGFKIIFVGDGAMTTIALNDFRFAFSFEDASRPCVEPYTYGFQSIYTLNTNTNIDPLIYP